MKFPLIELNVGRFSRLASWLLQADCDGDKGRNLTNGSLAAPSGRWRQGAVCDLRANCHQLPHFSPHTHTHTHTHGHRVCEIYIFHRKKKISEKEAADFRFWSAHGGVGGGGDRPIVTRLQRWQIGPRGGGGDPRKKRAQNTAHKRFIRCFDGPFRRRKIIRR